MTDIQMQNGEHRLATVGQHPIWTKEVDIASPIEDIGSVSTLVFRDPDNNLLMVCKRNES